MARKAAFLDRDGTLNDEQGLHYVHRVEDYLWIEGARQAILELNVAGFLVVVITNQAGIARGLYTAEDVNRLHASVQADLDVIGAHVDAFYFSPYHLNGVVPEFTIWHEDRKPGTGLFERGIQEHDIDPSRSFMVGDKASDLIPAKKLGMKTALVLTGHGENHRESAAADVVLPDIGAAANWIVNQDSQRRV